MEPNRVVLQIDANHPKAPALRRLASSYATMQRYPSGIELYHKQHEGAALEFLKALCDLLDLSFEDILSKVQQRPSAEAGNLMDMITSKLKVPSDFQPIVETFVNLGMPLIRRSG